MVPVDRTADLAGQLQKELILLHKDSQEAGLEMPNLWRRFVSWEHIEKMGSDYRPRELKLRSVIGRILEAKAQPDAMAPLRAELAAVLKDLEETIRPENTLLLQEMAGKLKEIAAAS